MSAFDRKRLIEGLNKNPGFPEIELNKPIVLFGASFLGRKTLTGLRKLNIEPVAFCDNDPNKHNKQIDGLKIYEPSIAAEKYGAEALFIVTIWSGNIQRYHFVDIKNQLIELKCKYIINFTTLYRIYEDVFLPYYCMGKYADIVAQKEEILEAYDLMADDKSKEEYVRQIYWRITLDDTFLADPVNDMQYFCDEIYKYTDAETFIDCGAYIGDTIDEYLKRKRNNFSKLIAFEPDYNNFVQLKMYSEDLDEEIKNKTEIYQCGVGDVNTTLKFAANGGADSFISSDGMDEIQCVKLDDHMAGYCPSVIKMDIEGYEYNALLGAEEIINKYRPFLAVCVYHKPDDLWRIPLLIHHFSREYRIYIRQHLAQCWDTICYAVPQKENVG